MENGCSIGEVMGILGQVGFMALPTDLYSCIYTDCCKGAVTLC